MVVVLDSPCPAAETARYLVACFNRQSAAAHLDSNRAFLTVRADNGYTVFPYGSVLYGLHVENAPGGSTVHIVPYVESIAAADLELIRTCIDCLSKSGQPPRCDESPTCLIDDETLSRDNPATPGH